MRTPIDILVVEDDPNLRQATIRVLNRAGYVTREVEDGERAMAMIQARKPDLILLDVDMPRVNGLEVCNRIKSDPALSDIFVAMISGTLMTSDQMAEGLDMGADEYVPRPIGNRELLARVNAMVRIKQAEDRLKGLNLDLESEVRNRTEELLAANAELKTEKEEKEKLARELADKNNLLQALARVQERYIRSFDAATAFKAMLDTLIELTQSEYGFIGEIIETIDTSPIVKVHAFSDAVIGEEFQAFYESRKSTGLEFSCMDSLYGQVVMTGKPVISNAPDHDGRKAGLPQRHPPLKAFLGLPVYYGEDLVGMAGIANRPGGYDDSLVDAVSPLMRTWGTMIQGQKDYLRRRAVEQALERNYQTQKIINTLLELSQEPLALDEILDRALHQLVAIPWLSFQSKGAIFLMEGDPARLVMKAHSGIEKELIEACAEVPVGKCLCGLSAQTGHIQFAGNLDERHAISFNGITPHGHYCVPLVSRKEVIGVLTVYLENGHPRAVAEEDFLKTVTSTLTGIILRKKAEEALKASELSYRSLLDASPDAIIVYNMDGYITYVNPAFERVFGQPRRELLGRPLSTTLGANWPETLDVIEQMLNEQVPQVSEIRQTTRYGKEIDLQMSAALYIYQDMKKAGTIVTLRDISDKKRVEKLYLEKEAAQAASKAKSEFLASMSHELRTPLNSVIGFAEVVLDQYFGPLNDKQENYLRMIAESGRHLLSLINDVLDLSKIEAGKMELDFTPVLIVQIAHSSLDLIREKALKKEIELTSEIPSDLNELEITADERAVKQVLFNLFSNAVKFTPEKGRIRICIRLIRQSELLRPGNRRKVSNLDSDHIEMTVEDNGIGLDPKDLEKIFTEFYQVQSGYRDKTPGTGLGLPLTRRLVEMHKGRIWAESDGPGKGTRVKVVLPIRRPDLIPVAFAESGLNLTRVNVGNEASLVAHLQRVVEQAKAQGKPFTLCRFQANPDYLAEKAEDITRILEKGKRDDDLLAMDQQGGFYLVLTNITPEKGRQVIARAKARLTEVLENRHIACAAAAFPEDGVTSRQWLDKLKISDC